jgi:hypothetical protein
MPRFKRLPCPLWVTRESCLAFNRCPLGTSKRTYLIAEAVLRGNNEAVCHNLAAPQHRVYEGSVRTSDMSRCFGSKSVTSIWGRQRQMAEKAPVAQNRAEIGCL